MARPIRSLRTPGSANREVFSPQGGRISDLSRDRPEIPGVYTDLADVDYSGSVYDGQAWTYDAASGMHKPRSTMYQFGAGGAVPVAVGSTGPLELLDNGAAWKLQARLATAGTSTTTLVMKLNGTTVATLNLASGVLSNFVLLSSGSPVLPYIALMAGVDVVDVSVTAAGAGATGLQGYLAA